MVAALEAAVADVAAISSLVRFVLADISLRIDGRPNCIIATVRGLQVQRS